ncbi:MAG: branched-chain amino acid ABC transporter permease, partial [Pseudomonadota bacterium]
MDPLQLLIGGVANGCIYGLLALGFVLIYKATEAVNFAQGDMMMLGAFITLTLVNDNGFNLPFIVGVAIAIPIMAAVSYVLEMAIVRRLFGQPQFSVVVLTIALGFVLRFVAGVLWGHEPQ